MAVKVDATTRVPREFVKDGEIVLNIGIEATHQLQMGNEEITFQARFGGRPFPVVVPIERSRRDLRQRKWRGHGLRGD
jgi:stringent starvation protein B